MTRVIYVNKNMENKNRYKTSFTQLDLLGEGSFGQVFRVKDHSTPDKEFAIKKIVFQKDNEELNKYVLREIALLSRMSGDYIAKYICSWQEVDCVYIQMELMDDNLSEIIKINYQAFNRCPDQAFAPLEYYISCEMFKEILRGVQYLHQLKPPIIHRDLKPQNILISYNSTNGIFFKICDFGLSVVHDKTSRSHTQGPGSTGYCAPEVLSGRHYDTKADVFSTGIIAKELFNISDEDDQKSKLIKQGMDEKLKDLFQKLENQINSMLETTAKNRPTITEVLDKAMDWTLNKNVVNDCIDLESTVKNLKGFENQFFYNYFAFKFENQ